MAGMKSPPHEDDGTADPSDSAWDDSCEVFGESRDDGAVLSSGEEFPRSANSMATAGKAAVPFATDLRAGGMTRLAVELRLDFFQGFLCHATVCTGTRAFFCERSRALTNLFRGVRIVTHFTNLIS
jgi:hypothetical protein